MYTYECMYVSNAWLVSVVENLVYVSYFKKLCTG